MNQALVSICIPTYRGAEFIGTTLQSVLAQTYQNLEIIVVDDNSPDGTEEEIRKFSDSRIKYFRNGSNLGPEGNWNRCRELAQGKYFKLLPHDDLLAPQCIERQVQVFEQDADHKIALVFGARHILQPDNSVLMERGLNAPRGPISGPQLVRRCIRAGGNLIGEPGSGLLRKSLVDVLGPFDASFPYVIDMNYWFRALAHGHGYYTGQTDSTFCIKAGSWSVAIGKNQHLDFIGMARAFQADARYELTALDCAIGNVRARINTVVRWMTYRYGSSPRQEQRIPSHPYPPSGEAGMSLLNLVMRFFERHLFARYVIVGAFNTLAGYLLYVLFLSVGFEYRIANLLALIIGIGISFNTQGRLVFRNPDKTLIFRYVACWALIYVANTYVIGQLIRFGASAYAAGAIATPINVLMSFVIQKYLIFKRPPAKESPNVDPR